MEFHKGLVHVAYIFSLFSFFVFSPLLEKMMQIDSYFLTWNYQIANFRRCILLKGTRKKPSWKSKKIHPNNSTLPRTALLFTFGLFFVFFEMYKPETSALAQFSTHSGKVNNYLDPTFGFSWKLVTIRIVKLAYESPIHGTTYNLLIHKGYNPLGVAFFKDAIVATVKGLESSVM